MLYRALLLDNLIKVTDMQSLLANRLPRSPMKLIISGGSWTRYLCDDMISGGNASCGGNDRVSDLACACKPASCCPNTLRP